MSRRESAGILGFGAVACVACCAGPMLAFVGGLAAVSLGVAVLIGSVGVALGAIGVLAFVTWRRTRRPSCDASSLVAVNAPTRQAPRST
jgi:hypothetical protein